MRAVESNEEANNSSARFCRESECSPERRRTRGFVRQASVVLQKQKVKWTFVILLVTAVLSSIVAVLSKGDNQTPASVFQSAVENFIKTQRVLTLVNDTLRAVLNVTTTDTYFEHGI